MVPTLPPAPDMFSTKKFLPVWALSCCEISRATRSVGPPGAKPTMTLTGRSGQAAAAALTPARLAARKRTANAKCFLILCRLLTTHGINPPPLAGEGREGARGIKACPGCEDLPPLPSLRSASPPQAGEREKNQNGRSPLM